MNYTVLYHISLSPIVSNIPHSSDQVLHLVFPGAHPTESLVQARARLQLLHAIETYGAAMAVSEDG